jgi:hypothetical protein
MSGAGQQVKDKPWLLPVLAGGTALTGGLLAPTLAAGAAGGAAAAGASAAAGAGASGAGLLGSLGGFGAEQAAILAAQNAGLGVGADFATLAAATPGPSIWGGLNAATLPGSAASKMASKTGMDMLQQQMQQQPQPGMGQRPMSMDASNQMPANGVPQFNPRASAGTIGGAEFMRRRRGLA